LAVRRKTNPSFNDDKEGLAKSSYRNEADLGEFVMPGHDEFGSKSPEMLDAFSSGSNDEPLRSRRRLENFLILFIKSSHSFSDDAVAFSASCGIAIIPWHQVRREASTGEPSSRLARLIAECRARHCYQPSSDRRIRNARRWFRQGYCNYPRVFFIGR